MITIGNGDSIVGLDVSLTDTGVGFFCPSMDRMQTLSVKSDRKESDMRRIRYIVKTLHDYIYDYNERVIKCIVLEGYSFNSYSGKAKERAELIGIIKYEFGKLYPILTVPPRNLKTFVAGKGNASKEEMKIGLNKNFGYRNSNDNIVDAIGLSLYGKAVLVDREKLYYERVGV